jgi:hypothetical protein
MTIWASPHSVLPARGSVGRVLVFRTAPMAQVRAAVSTLRSLYPTATFAVLGTRLDDPFFDGFEKYEIAEAWVTPHSYRAVRAAVERSPFDLAVLCLNSDHVVGYARASLVMAAVPAKARVVAGYTGSWDPWDHAEFAEPGAICRWIVDSLLALLYVLVPLYFFMKSTRPRYETGGSVQTRPTEGAR